MHLSGGGEGADPIQDAFDRCGALQCGFCQPGMMLSARALVAETPRPHRCATALTVLYAARQNAVPRQSPAGRDL
ncbi:MAG: 2Fe-2S iron-sulfur cluster-binding protein [Pseudomonadota bacterium]